jgi:DNA replication licensing factor MCM3
MNIYRILNRPREHIIALQEVISELALQNDPSSAKVLKTNELQVGFDGSFGSHAVSPRGLLSSLLNKLVVVEGIVTKCSSVRPKLVRSVHFCPVTKSYTTKEYRDATDLDIGIEVRGRERLPTSSAFPMKDADGNPLEVEHGFCQYKDYQTVVLQEMPERARVGQLPRSIELILQHDLVDKIKPGDRAQCMGVYRPLASVQNGQAMGLFRSVVMCNNVSVIGKEVGAVRLSGADVGHIREVSEKPSLLNILARSFCPSIFGHEFVKKALILQLLGGCERNLENGTHLRGDINVMMVGDPSTAKSQLLRAVLDIAPLAISTTGRGSSGVGLTAAVTSDSETGERRLEAGAMVLADRGVVCIDEFDKMSEVSLTWISTYI